MKTSNIIIAGIFLVLISLFSLNFEKLTGYVPLQSKIPSIDVAPDVIKSGEKINVRVRLRGYCIDPEFEIVRVGGLHQEYTTYLPTIDDCYNSRVSCKANKYCPGDLNGDILDWSYKTRADYSGEYEVVVKYLEKPGQESSKDRSVTDSFIVS